MRPHARRDFCAGREQDTHRYTQESRSRTLSPSHAVQGKAREQAQRKEPLLPPGPSILQELLHVFLSCKDAYLNPKSVTVKPEILK